MFRFFKNQSKLKQTGIVESRLFDETTFYQQFIRDLENCENEVVIESPYITTERMSLFFPVFRKLLQKKVEIYILTRDPREHSEKLEPQAEKEIVNFEKMGVHTFICKGNDHRKLAILDRKVLWEGSLNILSQIKSREIMRRIESEEMSWEMIQFINLKRYI